MCGHMILLAEDRVVNVRICMARGLRDHCTLFESEIISESFMSDPVILRALAILQNDKCKDVLDLIS